MLISTWDEKAKLSLNSTSMAWKLWARSGANGRNTKPILAMSDEHLES
jgi:hypothetical protein